jgi:hypothetical protein
MLRMQDPVELLARGELPRAPISVDRLGS